MLWCITTYIQSEIHYELSNLVTSHPAPELAPPLGHKPHFLMPVRWSVGVRTPPRGSDRVRSMD